MATRIEIVPPQESWSTDFGDLKKSVMRAAPPGSYQHHIGSTAVPGLAAKDTIDLQLTVPKLASIDDDAFAAEGFEYVPGFASLPVGPELAGQ